MKKTRLAENTICLLFVFLICGCATLPERAAVKEVVPEKAYPVDILRQKALDFENTGEQYKALQLWKSVRQINSKDSEAHLKIAELEAAIQTKAGKYFKKGLAYYRHQSIRPARKAFLLALYHNPEHQEALEYLKNRLPGDDIIFHETVTGDTLPRLAGRYYKDPAKDFLISYYNDLDRNKELKPGIVLKLPILELSLFESPQRPPVKTAEKKQEKKTKLLQPLPGRPLPEPLTSPQEIMKDIQVHSEEVPPEMEVQSEATASVSPQVAVVTENYQTERLKKENWLDKARKLFELKKYNDSISAAEKVLDQDEENLDATALINASYYQLGKDTSRAKDYETALKYYSLVDPDYKDVSRLKAGIEVKLAEKHYLRGVKYFLKEEIQKAIDEWELTLALNPDHARASSDMAQAKKILKKVKEIK